MDPTVDEAEIDRIERSNLVEIERLNQRGGRTLSIVDLMDAGTITPEAAGYLLWRVAHGASFLTGAVPGGAGKSTLLADLLAMLPSGVKIVTTPDDNAVARALAVPDHSGRCYLCHEIGSGMWFGYLWGRTVADFLKLMENGGRIAACLHADDPAQVREILLSPTLGVSEQTFARVDLLVFMAFGRVSFGVTRRVSGIWSADGHGGHELVFGLDARIDALQPVATVLADTDDSVAPTLEACQSFMRELASGERRFFEDVRSAIVGFYRRQSGD